jgi:hypothetical protein
MRRALILVGLVLSGVVIGISAALLHLRLGGTMAGGMGSEIRVGPWSTGRDIGTAEADSGTRAVVALRGLLALPKSEARYFTAATDSAGRRLSGRCTYAVTGTEPDGRWWSVTVYDPDGWLIANPQRQYSLGGETVAGAAGGFGFIIGPGQTRDGTIPTGTDGPFELTLRVYRPRGAFANDPARAALPRILRGDCR